jgi:multidrug efflux pump subunit AcrB
MDQVRSRVEQQVPGLDIELSQLMEDLIGDLTEVPQPIEIKLFGDKPGELSATAARVARAIGGVAGVVDVRNGINPAGDALDVHVYPNRAALAGLTPDQVTAQVRRAIAGSVAAQLPQGPKMVGVRVWLPRRDHARVEQLENLPIRGAHGTILPLSQLARIREVNGQPEIDRDNLKRMVAVTARISGRGLGSTIADVKHVLSRPGMVPAGMYYQLGGLYAQQQKAFHDLSLVLVAAIALVFTLLLFLYESFRVALSILAMPLLALSMVFIGLWVTGIQLNITAIMGMTMIVGIVTELAIFYFSEFEDARRRMDPHDARRYAGRHRMRPILMSTIAAILTLMPLALALGRGAQMQQPLAVAIISGMLVQVPLVLLLMPAVHAVLTGESGKRA